MMWWDPLFEAKKKTVVWVRVWVDRACDGQQKLGLEQWSQWKRAPGYLNLNWGLQYLASRIFNLFFWGLLHYVGGPKFYSPLGKCHKMLRQLVKNWVV